MSTGRTTCSSILMEIEAESSDFFSSSMVALLTIRSQVGLVNETVILLDSSGFRSAKEKGG